MSIEDHPTTVLPHLDVRDPFVPDGPAPELAELEARHVSAWFGDRLVLDRVSLTMHAGSIKAMLGG